MLITVFAGLAGLLVLGGSAVYVRLFRRISDSEHKYRHLIDTASEAIFILDRATARILDGNRKAEEILGGPIEQFLGTMLPLRLLEDAPDAVASLIHAKRETQLRSARGVSIDVECSASEVHVRGAKLIELILYDITERKRAAAELRAARDAALEASRAKSEFLANMSHEDPHSHERDLSACRRWRFPPSTMRTGEDMWKPRNFRRTPCWRSSTTCWTFPRSRPAAWKSNPFRSPSAVWRRKMIRRVEPRAREKGLAMSYRISDTTPDAVVSDPLRLRQILTNLLSNAIKFTDLGRIDINIGSRTAASGGINLDVEVVDTGIGISPAVQSLIFESFRQADGSTTRRHGGAGLGLTISARLVALMGGAITVESSPGKGSAFRFSVPCRLTADGTVFSGQPVVRAAPRPNRKLRILLAEDNPINQRLAQRLLEKRGHSVSIAGDGRQALDRVMTGTPFDLILMDVQMPRMDGLEATRAIRRIENPALGLVPIVALTAFSMKSDQDRCREAGMNGHLAKPIDPVQLWATVEGLTAQAS